MHKVFMNNLPPYIIEFRVSLKCQTFRLEIELLKKTHPILEQFHQDHQEPYTTSSGPGQDCQNPILEYGVPECVDPPEVDFGEIISDSEHKYGDKVQYGCDLAYTLSGSEWITCTGSNWTSPPKCLAPCRITKQELDERKLLLSNNRSRTISVPHGGSLEFRCKQRYTIKLPPSVRVCVDGHMDFPLCILARGKNCGPAPGILNGDVLSLNEEVFPAGAFVEYGCQKLYTLDGGNKSFCSDGQWTATPKCLRPCFFMEEDLATRNMMTATGSHVPQYIQVGASFEITCKSGYILESEWNFTVQCKKDQIVYPKCIELCELSAKQMEENNVQLFWATSVRHAFSHLNVLDFVCRSGYTADPNSPPFQVRCLKGKMQYPKCATSVSCRITEQDLNVGRLLLINNQSLPLAIPHGGNLEFRCEQNYTLTQPSVRKCVNGTMDFPLCVLASGKNCSTAPGIPNGDIVSLNKAVYPPGAFVEYRCQNLYTLDGRNKSFCSDGQWTAAPKCLRPCFFTEELLANWNMSIATGSHVPRYVKIGDSFRIKCNSGYILDSQSNDMIQCKRDQIIYPKCLEKCVLNSTKMAMNNLRRSPTLFQKIFSIYTVYSSFFEFVCKGGYTRDSMSSPFKVKCLDGKIEYPKCIAL
ncbi:complement factor H-like [Tachyglossus aculeatus]|uniref:complement factor H-like n=1 Tax=Tachyglossus aculeatus TaxID=9261 RepID=UPI0018F590F5|nr:complement factor H-like [Tachyglossus aculeatus]